MIGSRQGRGARFRLWWLALVPALACQSTSKRSPTCDDQRMADPPLTQAALDELGHSLLFKLALVKNVPDDCASDAPFGLCHDAVITLQNTGPAISPKGWSVYFTSPHHVLRTRPAELGIRHVNGTLNVIVPASACTTFPTGQMKTIPFQAAGCMLSESEAMPRAYVAGPGLTPVVLANTDTEDPSAWLSGLDTDQKTLCGSDDQTVLATAATRFADNDGVSDLGRDRVATEIVPRPQGMILGEGAWPLDRGLALLEDTGAAATRASEARAALGAGLARLGVPVDPSGIPVTLTVAPEDDAFKSRAAAEAYRLKVNVADGAEPAITIVGADSAGAFYGVQSLLALISSAQAGGQTGQRLPALEIPYDAPRFAYRGLHIDVARNFHRADWIVRVLAQMATYKLNALHLHLSDDEGFRLEIPGLPELTTVGARRCHETVEKDCLLPTLGSGPFSDNTGSGFYTRGDFVRILKAAKALAVDVIPEIDMPGHARAAVRAMATRRAAGERTYDLSDPDDTSKYLSIEAYKDNVLNPCLESTYTFIAKVMDEIAAMYVDAGAPLRTWHVGADEIPAGAWTASPACAARLGQAGVPQTVRELPAYFLSRVNLLAQTRGWGLRAYTEGALQDPLDLGGPMPPLRDVARDFGGNAVSLNYWSMVQYFDNLLGPLSARDFGIVLTNVDFLFFDHAQETDPKERGLSWGTRFNDARKVFGYMPGNLAANAQLSADCQRDGCALFLDGATPIADGKQALGMEATLWGETIRTDEQAEAMLFPRLLALAERAWHRAAWEPADGMDRHAAIDRPALVADWERFANVLGHVELPKLDRAGIAYRIEVPGARLVDGRLAMNVAFPGLRPQYRNETGDFVDYDATNPPAIAPSAATAVRAVTASGRAGRDVAVPASSAGSTP